MVRPYRLAEHHADHEFIDHDRELGDTLADTIGDLFIDYNTTPAEQWRTVARALRVHGLTITDMEWQP